MSDPETQYQPLVGGQTAINVPSTQSGRSTRAYKVAGITLLVCVLIAGQAMIAYFVLSQRSEIKSLEEQGNDLKAELTKGTSGSVPVRTRISMKASPNLMDTFVDEDSSTEKAVPPPTTDCQLEAAGLKPQQMPRFRPECDERGLYLPQQCLMDVCWCVNPADGRAIPDTTVQGPASCGAAVRTGSAVLTLPDVSA